MKKLISANQFEHGKYYKIDEIHGTSTLKLFWKDVNGVIRVKTTMGVERIKPLKKFKFYEVSNDEIK